MIFSEYSHDHGCNGTVVRDSEKKIEQEKERAREWEKKRNIKKGIEKKT